jgi:uncharacterized protein (DUF427 family)/class 3 adenylate cyclase
MTADGDYEIRFERRSGRVRVAFHGREIADSSRAIIVHETRVAPQYYFPPEDVRFDHLEKTDFKTHCPFKGNASYWSIVVDGVRAENAAWGYEEPYHDAETIRGYVAFYRDKISALQDEGEVTAAQERSPGAIHANPLAAWLMTEGWKAPSSEALMQQFCDFLRDNGYPIARSTVIMPTLHPQIFATVLVWRSDAQNVRVVFEPHDILLTPRFADSPFAPIIRGAGGVRRQLCRDDVKLDFPVVRDLHAEGATDYVAMPFRFSDGQINVISMTSFAPGGFTTAHLGNIFEALPVLGRLFEVHAQRRISVGLLDTYLGRATGKRVLEGQIKHGDGEVIHAVIWFCDLRNSTQLSDNMDPALYLCHLNRFFMAMASAIIDNGGEILSYIGDAILAIFAIDDGERPAAEGTPAAEACRRAIDAAQAAAKRIAATNAAHPDLPALSYGIGLHVGDVTYGNIGIPQRLQFTVIGSATNQASRIEEKTKVLGEPVVCSAKFAESYAGPLVSQGFHALKGVSGTHELFSLANASG